MKLFCNCCDGIYNSIDVHFTSLCDNRCAHCIDMRFHGVGARTPDVSAILSTIQRNMQNIDDVLFLGGEPCLFLGELVECVDWLKKNTQLKVFVTTAVPRVCATESVLFDKLLTLLDGINLSVQHHNEEIADVIRGTVSTYDRQQFYRELPLKNKIRINLNLVRPHLSNKEDITDCLHHYDSMGFNSIKLSEIQHGKEVYVSFADLFGLHMPSAYAHGCQTYLSTQEILPKIKTPVLLKRSCFLCEESLTASLSDALKVVCQFFVRRKANYGVVYGNGQFEKGWV